MDNGNKGSGFFIASNQIATSYGVIKGASSGHVSPILQKEKYPIVGIVAIDAANELVILKISETQGTPLSIGDSDLVRERDIIYTIGADDRRGDISNGRYS